MPNFRIGDKVRRRMGTLGATGAIGEIIAIETRRSGDNELEMVTVRFESRTETFHWDVYERVNNEHA